MRRAAPATVSARLRRHVTLEAHANGEIVAYFDGYSVGLGTFSAGVADRAKTLRMGLPLASFASGGGNINKAIDLLVRRLAARGLLEYRLGRSRDDADLAVIEPQTLDYWPQTPQLRDAETLVLSRFAYMRRRGDEMVLESPRAGALIKICDPRIATAIAILSAPQKIKQLRALDGFPGVAFLALLVDCQIVFKVDGAGENGLRRAEGDDNLVLWDFHDLLFHARSTEGRHANPLGGVYPHAGLISPLPAVRPQWPGKKIDLRKVPVAPPEAISPVAKLLRERHSTRSFDDQRPITLAELSRFLDGAARVLSTSNAKFDLDEGGHTVRPYPSAGAAYELELYLAVDKCEGLARGFYHYDANAHALAQIGVSADDLEALLAGAAYAMGAPAAPQILITIAARFGRISWKYSSIAYSLILKDVGVLTQTLYLMATDMGLGGCAIGIANIDRFAKMTGIEFHVEGPVGQFAIGRGAKSEAPD
ncbi:SagB family peptide dehydrogenase [Methylocapsa polymorpha]|uniref:SagB family peptide dehydrogenase n=1 Tax=Methylocapsa polymorpha TaxID=3080828 RepID=A0ABZ0HQ07_9HYPH|nr:SagB family peptide dehydrogenase [Methylocapsa sp. RX1]